MLIYIKKLSVMSDNKDWERLKNFTLFKFYGTDKEFEEAAPFFGCFLLVVVVVVGILWLFGVVKF
jgi:hypothetical protein